MPKAIREIYTDLSGNVSVEYSDESTRNFNLTETAVIAALQPTASASRNITSADFDKIIPVSAAATFTIPSDAVLGITDSTNAYAIGFYQAGTGAVTIAGSGATVRGTAPTAAQYSTVGVMRVGDNEWAYLGS